MKVSEYVGKKGNILRNLSLHITKTYIKDIFDNYGLCGRILYIVAEDKDGNIFSMRFCNSTAGYGELVKLDEVTHRCIPKLEVGSTINIARAKVHYQKEYYGMKTNYLHYVKVA